jgi:hypothetical protein
MTYPSQRERQFMQYLQGAGWVKAIELPSSPRIVENLLSKGWIERRHIEKPVCYRITNQGHAAKKQDSGNKPAKPSRAARARKLGHFPEPLALHPRSTLLD